MNLRTLSVFAIVACVGAANAAITFSNFVYDSTVFPTAPVASGNALTWLPSGSQAAVGDPSGLPRNKTISFTYDVLSTDSLIASNTTAQRFLAGSGTATFTQTVYELDGAGSVLGILGTVTGTNASNAVSFAHGATHVRIDNQFVLDAPATTAFDLASLSLVNQNVTPVPEPATWAALGMGLTAIVRRRRARV